MAASSSASDVMKLIRCISGPRLKRLFYIGVDQTVSILVYSISEKYYLYNSREHRTPRIKWKDMLIVSY